ncbi:hypothetical protein AB1N83_013943, partial [Pleurotus pulmonarius]
ISMNSVSFVTSSRTTCCRF